MCVIIIIFLVRLSERMGDVGHGQVEIYSPQKRQWLPACADTWDEKDMSTAICEKLGYR